MLRPRLLPLLVLNCAFTSLAHAELKVGVGKAIISPDPLLPVSGGIGPGNPTTGKQGELHARAMVFQQGETKVAVVQLDLLGFPSVLCTRVHKQVPRIPADNILFGLTNDAFGYILTKVDFNSFKRYEYISRTSLGEMTGEILIENALKLIEGDEPTSPASKSTVSKSTAERDAMKIPTKIAGAYSGGELVELRVRDRMAYLIKPSGKVDPQKRWLWDFPFWLAINDGFGNVAHRYYVEESLAAGFHIAGVDVGPSCGSPAAAEVCQEFYEQLVSKHGLHKRARVLAHSHGGLIAYGWAFRHPACVDRIAGMCPATDFRTYPTLPNVVTGPTKGLDYGLSLEELDRRAGEFNPIENLAPLAKAGAKILHLHGDEDTLVPTSANSMELARRYRELGGEAEIVLLKDLGADRANSRGHDGPELYESAPLLKFLLAD